MRVKRSYELVESDQVGHECVVIKIFKSHSRKMPQDMNKSTKKSSENLLKQF